MLTAEQATKTTIQAKADIEAARQRALEDSHKAVLAFIQNHVEGLINNAASQGQASCFVSTDLIRTAYPEATSIDHSFVTAELTKVLLPLGYKIFKNENWAIVWNDKNAAE